MKESFHSTSGKKNEGIAVKGGSEQEQRQEMQDKSENDQKQKSPPSGSPPPSINDIVAGIATQVVEQETEAITERVTNLESSMSQIEPRIEEIAKRAVEAGGPSEIKITAPDPIPPITLKNPHAQFAQLLKVATTRHPNGQTLRIMLSGPMGSGKGYGCEQLAEALQRPYGFMSVCEQSTETKLLGYMDLNGKYVPSLLYHAVKEGWVFLLDEVDNGNANVLNALNAPTSSTKMAFPHEVVDIHPNFVLVCAANTWGHGATDEYVGRCPLDAAFLDRFVKIKWNYDEALELRISPVPDFARYVQKLRVTCHEIGIKITLSPRISIHGGAMLLNNIDPLSIMDWLIFPGMDKATVGRILEKVGPYIYNGKK